MKHRSVLVLFFMFCTAVFTLFTHSTPAHAAPGDQWARWFVELTFANNKPTVTMTVEIGHETRQGTQQVDIRERYPVDCQEHGALNISATVAEFDGQSYLTCEMPNFQEAVAKLTQGKLEINDSCSCKLANGLANFSFDSNSANPLFYMPKLQFSAPAHANGSLAQYKLVVNGVAAESEPFLINNKLQLGSGSFVQNGAGYIPEFYVDGTVLSSNPPYISGLLALPTNQTKFYIGYNPDSGESLQGKLSYLFIDPGCVGHGGI